MHRVFNALYEDYSRAQNLTIDCFIVGYTSVAFIKQIGNKYFTLDSLDSILKLARKDCKITSDKTGKRLLEFLCGYLAKVRLSQEEFVRSLCEDIFLYENFERLKGNIEKFIENNFAVTSK